MHDTDTRHQGEEDTNGSGESHEPDAADSRAQLVALVVGAVFIVVGAMGFIPGLTTHFHGGGGMRFSGPQSMSMLFGVFMVSVLHNAVHLAYGLVAWVCSFNPLWARLYLVIGGAIYLVLWIYGLVINRDSNANFLPVNSADNWLNFGLGVGMIALAVLVRKRRRARS